MRLLWRSLLVCLMALALPVQGLAAAGLLHCAPFHERLHAQASTMQTDAAPASSHEQAHTHAHAHAAGHHGSPAAAQDHGDSGHTCSACAACCPAIGLPGQAVGLPSAPIGGFAADAAPAPSPSFVPAGLERPPRA